MAVVRSGESRRVREWSDMESEDSGKSRKVRVRRNMDRPA